MSSKKSKNLISKTVKKIMKKEIGKLQKDNLTIVSTQANQSLDNLAETFAKWEDKNKTEEIIDDIYSNSYSIATKEDAELERKLRELKFKQELRKDWILFLLKDVIVYSVTVIFIFVVAGFYLVTLIHRY
jgi:two-component sensor histidine kinase